MSECLKSSFRDIAIIFLEYINMNIKIISIYHEQVMAKGTYNCWRLDMVPRKLGIVPIKVLLCKSLKYEKPTRISFVFKLPLIFF